MGNLFSERAPWDLAGFAKDRELYKQVLREETAKAIRRARLHAGLTQVELADCLNTYASYVSRIETGDKPVSKAQLERIHQAIDSARGGTIHSVEHSEKATS